MKTYKFDNTSDMIALAKTVQSSIYWGMTFYCEEEDSIDNIKYTYFWDLVEYKVADGFVGVNISDNNEVKFIK